MNTLISSYRGYTPDQLENHFSQFLIDSWSYSKVTTFSRNEKAFEMVHLYGQKAKISATTISGQAYHHALDNFFSAKKVNEILTLPDLEIVAFEYIDAVDANIWKLQKTTPTIEDCKKTATQTTVALLNNFFGEIGVYLDYIDEIIDVEVYCDEFLIINGVEIPLPWHGKLDLVVKTKAGKIAIIDHKSKKSFTGEDEMKLSIGLQAITYVVGYETKTGLIVEEVCFIENKYSQNRDKSPQLQAFLLSLDNNTRRLYEALLYEPLKRLITAVNDPDYVYLINDSDNMVDRAELYEFWAKTMISETEDFNIDPSKKDIISRRLKKIRDTSIETINPNVIKKFRQNAAEFIQYDLSNKDMAAEEKIEHVLRSFGVIVRVAHKFEGYSSNTFLLEVSAGVKVNNIQSHRLDVANALNVNNVRIGRELVVHEGRSYVPVEFAKRREHSLMFEPSDLVEMKIPIGKDNFGNVVFWNLNNQSTPHALICGGTGSGKTVEIRSIVEYSLLAGVKDIVILDPKYDLSIQNKKVKIYNDISDIERVAEELVVEMNDRIKRGISKLKVVVLDEFADAYLMMKSGKALDIMEEVQDGFYAPKKMKGPFGTYMSDPIPKFKTKAVGKKNSLEENIQSLLQKGRSSGYRLILGTQRADAKTISGSAKVNLPVQICFRVQKEIDSRVVLDEPGAESLVGQGDGLLRSPEYPDTVRFQAYYKP